MKATIRRLAAVLMAGLTVLLSASAVSFATTPADKNGTCGANALWAFSGRDAALTVTGSGAMTDFANSVSTPWRSDDAVWKNLYTVDIGKGITHVGQYAFAGCVYFTDLFIADTVTTMGNSAFASCAGLTRVSLPENLEKIPALCFSNCAKLKEIVIPATVSEIGNSAFINCDALTNICFCGTEAQWERIAVAENNSCLASAAVTCDYVPTATVTFHANNGVFKNGKDVITAEFTRRKEIVAPEIPTREGYAFLGWSPDLSVMDELRPRTYTATWKIVDYTLTYYCRFAQDGIWQTDTYHFGDEIDLPAAPSYTGYRFTGWLWKWNEDTVDAPLTMPSHSLTATAGLEPITYTVKLIAGSTVYDTFSAAYTDEIHLTCPDGVPTKRGYEFAGWTDGKANYAYGQTVSRLTPEDDGIVVFSARWNPLAPEASLTIRNNPGTRSIDYRQGIQLTAVTKNMPAGAAVHWFIGTADVASGSIFTKTDCREGFTVTAKIVDADGTVLTDYDNKEISDTETIAVNNGFFKKLVAFFRSLFGTLKTVAQSL